MKKNNFVSEMAAIALVMGFVLAGCASYGAGFSTMTGERDRAENISGVTQNFSGITVFGSDEYSEFSVGAFSGKTGVTVDEGFYVPRLVTTDTDIKGLSVNTYVKYPFYLLYDRLTLFPMVGLDVQIYDNFKYEEPFSNLVWRIGGGLDFSFSKTFFLRGSVGYAPLGISGVAFNIGIGFRTASDPVKGRYKTGANIKAEQVRVKTEKERKDAQSALDAGDWSTAIEQYTRIITENPDDTASYLYYYKRSEAHAGAGNYAAALDDFNSATRINPVLQGTTGYQTWKQLVMDYEKANGRDAPMDDQGKLIAQSSRLKIANRGDASRMQGSGNGVSYPAGQYNFTFWYQDGSEKSEEATFALRVEAGHIYYADAARDGFKVTINIVDATERELRGGGTTPVVSKIVEITVPPLPSDLSLPSWVQPGMTRQQVRNRMSRAPDSTQNNVMGYLVKSTDNVICVFSFSDSGGLISYTASMTTSLNPVLSYFTRVIGWDPVKSDDGDNNDRYTWLVPFNIRDDIFILRVLDMDDGDVAVYYNLISVSADE
jgi:hypothetical protein